NDTIRETLFFFRQGKAVDEIARLRGLKDGTIYSHLEDALLAGETVDVDRLLDVRAREDIAAAFARFGFGNLTGAVESLAGRYTHSHLRIYRAATQSRSGRQ